MPCTLCITTRNWPRGIKIDDTLHPAPAGTLIVTVGNHPGYLQQLIQAQAFAQ